MYNFINNINKNTNGKKNNLFIISKYVLIVNV